MSGYQSQSNTDKIQFHVPSQYQFFTLSLQNYTDLTLKKIETHLNNRINKEPVQKSKYYKLSNEELRRRSNYLQIVFALMSVYNQLSCELNPQTLQLVSKTNKCIILSMWLSKLKLTNEQLSRLARIKQNLQQEINMDYFNRKLMGLLFQTQIYIFQILVRLMIIQKIHSQTDKYYSELRKLKSKFNLNYQPSNQLRQQQLIINEMPMPKSSQMRCKQLYKQINKIITYYQLEISMNRPICSVKPELQYLIQFSQQTFTKELVTQIFKSTELGKFSLQLKPSKKDTIFVPTETVIGKDLKQSQLFKKSIINKQNLIIQQIYKDNETNPQSQQLLSINNEESFKNEDSNKPSQASCGFAGQSRQNQTNKNAELNTQNVTVKVKVARPESCKSQKSNKSRQRESAVSVYLKQKTNKFEKVISEYSQYKKLQYISSNQRFSSRFNIHNKLFRTKDRTSSDFSNFHLEERYENDKPEQRTPFYDKQND